MTPVVSGAACSYAMAVVILTALLLGTWALVVAGFQRWRLGSRLLAECCGDYATAWAELRELEAKNLADERLMREAMVGAYRSEGEAK